MVEELREALSNIRENWKRALLTSSGVMAATIATVLLASIAIGVRKDFTDQVEDIGVNTIIVIPAKISGGFPNINLGGASYLKERDAENLRGLEGVQKVACWTFVGGGANYKDRLASSFLVATTPEWFQIKKFDLSAGRLLMPVDDDKMVCVIGSLAKQSLFPTEDAVGKAIKINGKQYEVVGVTHDQSQESSLMSFGSFQNLIYIPYAGLHKAEPASQTDRILVQLDPRIEPEKVLNAMRATLRKNLDDDQFDLLTQKDLLKVVYRFTDILQWLLVGLTGISLFIGGIGIMNVMLLSVGERTSEIGIRKATGANRGAIFRLFMTESVLISLFGVMVGLGFSFLVCRLLDRFSPIHPIVTVLTVLGTIGSGLLTGMFFGILPAARAAKMDPVKAIQNLN
ncbi:MAG: FtsX-like permease family protein [Armatimonadetes bacterium]|nr:FtsX-like permease family protein [Armatimonadota bacterium]